MTSSAPAVSRAARRSDWRSGHLLVVDDDALLADLLEAYLARLAPSLRISKARSVLQALGVAEQGGDLTAVLLDLRMPDMDGWAGLQHFRRLRPDTPVVIMSADERRQAVRDARRAGAHGYIRKGAGLGRFGEALDVIATGGRYFRPEGDDGGPLATADAPDAEAAAQFSRREREILAELVDGLSNKEIAHRLELAVVTVTLHLSSIYRKLGVTRRAQAIRLCLEQGLVRRL